MKVGHTVYYSSFDDDFAGTDIKTKRVNADFKYVRRGPVWLFFSFLLYHVIARPTAYGICLFRHGIRIKNRRAVRKLRKSGFFLYGNHTQILDAFVPHLVSYPHKAFTVAGPDAVSLPGLKHIVQMLGALPVPSGLRGLENFRAALEYRYRTRSCVAIYPEAHIWPYYTGIRPFGTSSFTYPVKLGAPVVAICTTYRRRTRFGREIRPGWTVWVSDPMYPDASLPPRAAQAALRDMVYGFMKSKAEDPDNYEYVRYEYTEPKTGAAQL